jgi:hypothetical protein
MTARWTANCGEPAVVYNLGDAVPTRRVHAGQRVVVQVSTVLDRKVPRRQWRHAARGRSCRRPRGRGGRRPQGRSSNPQPLAGELVVARVFHFLPFDVLIS